MSGAYVAKPAVVSVPDVPPGWDPDWPLPGDTETDPNPFFPAPFPPGYENDYSIVTTATASMAPTATASVTSSVRDYDDYVTNEPSVVTWTATINGLSIDLKFDGESFASSIEEDPIFSTYWGTTPDIIFDLDDSNDGDTVVLEASCTLLNSDGQVEILTDTSEITIDALVVITGVLRIIENGFVSDETVELYIDGNLIDSTSSSESGVWGFSFPFSLISGGESIDVYCSRTVYGIEQSITADTFPEPTEPGPWDFGTTLVTPIGQVAFTVDTSTTATPGPPYWEVIGTLRNAGGQLVWGKIWDDGITGGGGIQYEVRDRNPTDGLVPEDLGSANWTGTLAYLVVDEPATPTTFSLVLDISFWAGNGLVSGVAECEIENVSVGSVSLSFVTDETKEWFYLRPSGIVDLT